MKVAVARTAADRAACFAVREAVFMREQGVPPDEEWDGLDEVCTHFLAGDADAPAGCARLASEGEAAKVQRVAVMPSHRGTGLGARLLRAVLDHARQAGFRVVVLDSQVQAIGFYEKLGFRAHGPEFLDAGIRHRAMSLSVS
ncbi:GNAT family N-acetyltransferase [Rhodobacteraceae bacterium W635]|uniref:GNAT family N-acetyltransferase n=1 Tax=Nioella halotolerans TaxID=2303578 RepID=UPI000E3E0A8A|nr:GNAT family N-acetyltransferase [Rhodobacteraceae bacterium W635]